MIYKFTCLRDADISYIGVTSRHFVTIALELLHSTAKKTANTQHINLCSFCGSSNLGIDSFKVLSQCNNDYKAKVQEALLIKKHQPKLNT